MQQAQIDTCYITCTCVNLFLAIDLTMYTQIHVTQHVHV